MSITGCVAGSGARGKGVKGGDWRGGEGRGGEGSGRDRYKISTVFFVSGSHALYLLGAGWGDACRSLGPVLSL